MPKNIIKLRNYLIYPLLLMVFTSLGLNVYLIFNRKKSPTPNLQKSQVSRVTRIIDGDTFDNEEAIRIRLYEIDAPHYPKGCLGIDAKVRLEELILNKNISIEEIKKDNFGRTLAYIYLDSLLVNEILVEEGLAYFAKDKVENSHSLQIEKAQTKAEVARRGVWSSLCQTKKEGCVIKGNYRSAENTRIYHTPDCYNYEKVTIKSGTSDRWFCSEDEASQAGFSKSLDCPK